MSNIEKQETHLQRIRIDGYTIVEKLLDQATIQLIKKELAPYFQGKKMGRNDFEGLSSERVYALLSKAPSIAQIIEHPFILSLLDELLPKNYLHTLGDAGDSKERSLT